MDESEYATRSHTPHTHNHTQLYHLAALAVACERDACDRDDS